MMDEKIPVCKKLRNLAKLGRIYVNEEGVCKGSHFLAYLKFCGVDECEFVKKYVSNLQPYMVDMRIDQGDCEIVICVIDGVYKISLCIRTNEMLQEEISASFHIDNEEEKQNELMCDRNERYVAIFADSVLSRCDKTGKYVVKARIQRGLKVLPLYLSARKWGDCFVVEKRAIELELLEHCNEYVRDLYTSDLDLDYGGIYFFSDLQLVQLTAEGNDVFSTMALLVECLCTQKDKLTREVTDFALITFCRNLKLTMEQNEELIELIRAKFCAMPIKDINTIIDRIEDYITIVEDTEV